MKFTIVTVKRISPGPINYYFQFLRFFESGKAAFHKFFGRKIYQGSMGKMIIEYCNKAIEKAEYRKLEDGTWFAEIPGFKGVWANGKSVEECRKELIDVLEEWLILKLRDKDPIPAVDGLKIEILDVAIA